MPNDNDKKYFHTEQAQEQRETERNIAIKRMAQKTQAAWEPYMGEGGYQRFAAPTRQAALQRVAMPIQAGEAYSASAGVGGPVGPAFPGAAAMPGIEARMQSFIGYMNTLTGPMTQELMFLDAESLEAWQANAARQQMLYNQ